MIKYVNGCAGCPPEMGCMGDACPYSKEPVYSCDWCESELGEDELREYKRGYICLQCYREEVGESEAETEEYDSGFFSLPHICKW